MIQQQPRKKGLAPIFLMFAGIISAFGLASCCAIPLFLISLGIGTSWITGVALLSAPYRTPLLLFGSIFLLSGAFMWWRSSASACEPGSVCAKPAVRAATLVGLIAGAGLLYVGYVYV